jgi:hypothetical protein
MFPLKNNTLISSAVFILFLSVSFPIVASDTPEANHGSDIEDHIKIAEQGDPDAQYVLALRYLDGQGVKKDQKAGILWLKKAIEQDYPKAVYRYAKLFEEGKAVPMNAKSAAEWYLKAAKLGVVGAQRKMGELYQEGKGVNKDPVSAYAWYNVSFANSGVVQDKIHREYIGFNLSPVEKDRAQAMSAELLK